MVPVICNVQLFPKENDVGCDTTITCCHLLAARAYGDLGLTRLSKLKRGNITIMKILQEENYLKQMTYLMTNPWQMACSS